MSTRPAIAQAQTVPLTGRPLLILDADEVLFLFADGFTKFLEPLGLYLDFSSYRLHGNVRRRQGDSVVKHARVTRLLDEFRADLDSLEPVEGAQAALRRLGTALDIVVLSNVSAAQAQPRLRNLAGAGFDFPLIANSGPKGPAVKILSERGGAPAFFVDDIPPHLVSAAEDAPEVFRIHFVGDTRLKPLLPPCAEAHLNAQSWADIERFVRDTVGGK